MSTVIILAGGKSKRMGKDKLSLHVGGESMLESVTRRFSAVFDNVYVSVAANRTRPVIPGIEQLKDEFENCGPMAGLHSGLKKTTDDGVFLVAADMPFTETKAALLIAQLGEGHDAAVIRHPNGYLEPLFAYYSKAILPVCEDCLKDGRYSMLELLHNLDIRYVTINELGEYWSEDLLFNINYPADYSGMLRRKTGTGTNQ